jgi:hypothetical protein
MVPPNRPTPRFTTLVTNLSPSPFLFPRGSGSGNNYASNHLKTPPPSLDQIAQTLGAIHVTLNSQAVPLRSLSPSDWAALHLKYAGDSKAQALITAFATALSYFSPSPSSASLLSPNSRTGPGPGDGDGDGDARETNIACVHAFLTTLSRISIPVGVGRVPFSQWGPDALRVLSTLQGGR